MRICVAIILLIFMASCSAWYPHRYRANKDAFTGKSEWWSTKTSRRLDKEYSVRKNMTAKIDSLYTLSMGRKMNWSYCAIVEEDLDSLEIITHYPSACDEGGMDILVDKNFNIARVIHKLGVVY